MPFDSIPIVETRKRLVALDGALLKFGASAQEPIEIKLRRIPPWHSSCRSEHIDSALSVLVRARALIADEQRWCRRTYARGWRGLPVPVQSATAQRFCALGAIMRAGRELGLPNEPARNALEWQTVRPVQDWNDDPARTHNDILAAFDTAITALDGSAA
jgi:hypothetical protein